MDEEQPDLQKNEDAPSNPKRGRKGYARHAHDWGDSNPDGLENQATSLESEVIDTAPVTKDYIDLGEILTEQLQLQVPYQPLCRTECKGICPHCGADLNVGRCACDKLVKDSPFSVLKDFQVKRTVKH